MEEEAKASVPFALLSAALRLRCVLYVVVAALINLSLKSKVLITPLRRVLPCLVVYLRLTSVLGESVWKSCPLHMLCGVLCSAALVSVPVFSSEGAFSLNSVFLNVLAFGGHYRGL